MYYTMNVSLNYFRKHVSKNIFSENIIKILWRNKRNGNFKRYDHRRSDRIRSKLRSNPYGIWNGMCWMPIISGRSIEQAAYVHGMDLDELLGRLNEYAQTKEA